MNHSTLTIAVIAFALLLPSVHRVSGEEPKLLNKQVDFAGFAALTNRLETVREKQLVSVDQFLEMAKDPDTIILDTRSKEAFDKIHIEGAVHLNFSDFTEEKLSKTVPDKNTRILIYCNNNFQGDKFELRVAALASKGPTLALNIPTFINLHGYGYENVYELGALVSLKETRIPLAGSSAK